MAARGSRSNYTLVMNRPGERGERIARRALWLIVSLPSLYLLSALVVFDFRSTAADFCQEYDDQRRPVAHGPEPRIILCRPHLYDFPGGASWDGSEWAFTVYRPICSVWLRLKGYQRADPHRDS
jgi:hypothetical protein